MPSIKNYNPPHSAVQRADYEMHLKSSKGQLLGDEGHRSLKTKKTLKTFENKKIAASRREKYICIEIAMKRKQIYFHTNFKCSTRNTCNYRQLHTEL